ncbi:MAG TPA: HNH endonuclease signature motif containing protein, partial [Polyangiales bacterium]|nr:HNH endonuclease signature motif containing protein [Polyangiales bacterium]
VSVLRMSEAQAYLRIGAARVARCYPLALEMLLEGALNLSTVKLLAPQLTAENHVTLLEQARGKTKREVELLIAEIAPKPDVPTRIRKLPARAARESSAQAELEMSASPDVQETRASSAMVAHAATAIVPANTEPVATAVVAPRASCVALSPGRYKLELTVDQSLFDQMMTLKHLLSHRVPGGDLGVVLGLAIKEFSERLRKQRFAELSKPASRARATVSQTEAPEETTQPGDGNKFRANKVNRWSRYVPRAVVREVFARDGAQCTFVSADGQRCDEREMLELDHMKAFAFGGGPTPDNLRVVCRSHNGYFATQDFGAAHMRMMRARAR